VPLLTFSWRRPLFEWEKELLNELVEALAGVVLFQEAKKRTVGGGVRRKGFFFPVRSTYKVLEELMLLEDNGSALERNVFGQIWESLAPSKLQSNCFLLATIA